MQTIWNDSYIARISYFLTYQNEWGMFAYYQTAEDRTKWHVEQKETNEKNSEKNCQDPFLAWVRLAVFAEKLFIDAPEREC